MSGGEGWTPGEWKIAKSAYGFDIFAHEPNGSVMDVAPWVASITTPIGTTNRNYPSKEQCASNARLIAAAPDLVAAVKGQHEAIDWLLARLITLDPEFLPTKSPVWPKLVAGRAALLTATNETEGRE